MARPATSRPFRPPHDLRAEAAILGAALLSREALEVLAVDLRPGDFYDPRHQAIAAALTRAWENDGANDPISVLDDLNRRGETAKWGEYPIAVLLELQQEAPATRGAPVTRWAGIVHDHATARRLLGVALNLAEEALDPGDVHALVLRAQEAVGDVAANNGARTYSSLIEFDVAALVAGDLELEQPQLLTREDGRSMLYAGKMHSLQSDPSVGKTFLALAACAEVLRLGGAAVFVDYEDTAQGVVGRLLALGADGDDVAQRFRYVTFDGPVATAELLDLDRILDTLNPDLVVIDGVAVALARDGLDENSNADVARWFERVPKPLARTGAAVLLLDHLAKDREKRGRHARGAGHKLAAIDGAAYELIVVEPFSRTKAGKFRLKISKDRPGAVGEVGADAAVVSLEPHADGARVILRVDPPGLLERVHQKPTYVMGMISTALEGSKVPVSAATLRNLVAAKPRVVDAALAHLKAEGFVIDDRKGRSTYLRLVRPYGTPAPSNGNGNGQAHLRLVGPTEGEPDDPDDDRPKL